MKRRLQRLSGLILAVLLVAYAPLALAGSGQTGYVAENTLPVYQQPHRLSKTLGIMAYGQSMEVLAWQDGWARVKNSKGEIGYCDVHALTPNNPNTLAKDAYVKEAGAYVFNKPGTGYARIGKVSMGQRFSAVAVTPDGRWVRVWNGKRYGYIEASAVSSSPVGRNTLEGEKVWIVGNKALVATSDYQGRGKSMGRVSLGQSYALLSRDGDRACLRNDSGKIAWVPNSCISKTNPNTLNVTMYARATGNYLFPNIGYGSAKRISKGSSLTVVAVTPDGNWSRVKKDGKYYYIQSDRLSIAAL